MLLVEQQPNTPGARSGSRFCLRIRSDATSQQVVELREGKTTIGSSPRCDIRIQKQGVQPLHCLILCDGDGLSVRRWAAGTRLNGQPFDEARIALGDTLTVGEIELEVEGAQIANPEIEAPGSNAGTNAQRPPSSPEAAPACDPWGEWSPTRQTLLSAERQIDALQKLDQADGTVAEPQTGGGEQGGNPQDDWQQSNSRLIGLHEQLLQLEEKVTSWKEVREAWQQEKSEWRVEREQTQRLWTEFQLELAEVQLRTDEIAGRLERLEHSIAAQALVPRFPISSVDSGPTESRPDQFPETFPAAESSAGSTSSLDTPTAPLVDRADKPKSETEDELAPFAEFSIWRQGVNSADARVGQSEVVDTAPGPSGLSSFLTSPELPTTSADKSWQAAPAKSFIEHYGHLFAEDEAKAEPSSDAPQTVEATGSADADAVAGKPQIMGRLFEGDAPQATAGDEEESIEQYMSKLLQRVRGDQPQVLNAQVPGATSPLDFPAGTTLSTLIAGSATKPPAIAGELPGTIAKGDWLTTSLGTVRRKAPMVEQPADMATLRALANETARRAISTHGLRIHRRNAITKVIVSMLAGVTSLWLMLDAGNWRNLQFMTGCVSLIAAAYWAGQTFCELIETFRAATYDGPEDKLQGFAELAPSNSQVEVKR